MEDRPLTTKEAAEYLSTTEQTLRTWRSSGKVKIPYSKVGQKVLYRREALDDYIKSREKKFETSA